MFFLTQEKSQVSVRPIRVGPHWIHPDFFCFNLHFGCVAPYKPAASRKPKSRFQNFSLEAEGSCSERSIHVLFFSTVLLFDNNKSKSCLSAANEAIRVFSSIKLKDHPTAGKTSSFVIWWAAYVFTSNPACICFFIFSAVAPPHLITDLI